MKTRRLVNVWLGLVCGVSSVACGGRSVMDDERAYGDEHTIGIKGRTIPALGTGLIDDPKNPTTRPTSPASPTLGVNPIPTNGPVGPITSTGTATAPTAPLPTTAPDTIAPTPGTSPVAPVTMPTTAVPTTGVPTTAVPTSEPATTSSPVMLVPFPNDGSAPSIPPGFDDVAWRDPWACNPEVYDRGAYCSLSFFCSDTQFNSASCSLSGDTWYCECSGNTIYASSQFASSAIVPGEACRVAGALCISDVNTDEGCSESLDQGRDYCTFSSFCNHELVAEKVAARIATQTYSTCSYSRINGQDYVTCGCSNTEFTEFSVDWDSRKSCSVVHDACTQGLDEGSLGEAECSWYSSTSVLSSCENYDRCVRSASVNGEPISLVSNVQTYCYSDGGDAWLCSCDSDSDTSGRYFADSSRQACEIARQDCSAALN